VFPAYYFQWGVIMLAGAWLVNWAPLSPGSVLAHVFMFFNIGPNPVTPIVGLWWSLPVELSFYLLLPLIAPFMRPGRWLILLMIGISISVIYRIWAADHFTGTAPGANFLAASQLPGSLPLFLLGASGALLVKWMHLKNIRPPSTAIATLLFLTGASLAILWLWLVLLPNGTVYWSGHWSMVVAPIALGLCMSTVILGLYWGSRLGNLLCANKVIYFIGVISYSLYLWHFVVMKKIQSLGGEVYSELPGLVQFSICTVASLVVASLSYFLIERPFFRLRRSS
jgi:peptidoglycan/LPS O-acetylase OafA/YrhL